MALAYARHSPGAAAQEEDAIVAAVSLVKTAADFGKGGRETAVKFLLAVRSPVFWHRAQLLRRLTKPLTTFGSWLRGCDCHEEERAGPEQEDQLRVGQMQGHLHQSTRFTA